MTVGEGSLEQAAVYVVVQCFFDQIVFDDVGVEDPEIRRIGHVCFDQRGFPCAWRPGGQNRQAAADQRTITSQVLLTTLL